MAIYGSRLNVQPLVGEKTRWATAAREMLVQAAAELQERGVKLERMPFDPQAFEATAKRLAAARNEFTVSAMGLTQSLSRRFWYHHYKQTPDMPETAKLHSDIARAIGSPRAVRA